jgi:hypothetical protein
MDNTKKGGIEGILRGCATSNPSAAGSIHSHIHPPNSQFSQGHTISLQFPRKKEEKADKKLKKSCNEARGKCAEKRNFRVLNLVVDISLKIRKLNPIYCIFLAFL